MCSEEGATEKKTNRKTNTFSRRKKSRRNNKKLSIQGVAFASPKLLIRSVFSSDISFVIGPPQSLI